MVVRPDLLRAIASLEQAAIAAGASGQAAQLWAHLHNYTFEERCAPQREDALASFLPTTFAVEDLAAAHSTYVKNRVSAVTGSVPDTFLAINAPAHRAVLADTEWVVRAEDIGWRLQGLVGQHGVTDLDGAFAWLENQFEAAKRQEPDAIAHLAYWISLWNGERDARPMFAVAQGDVSRELGEAHWGEALRTALGLAHWQPPPVYVAGVCGPHALPGQGCD